MLPPTIAETPTAGPPPDAAEISRLHRAHQRFMAEKVSSKLPADRPLAIQHACDAHTGFLSASTDPGLPGLLAYYLDEPGLYSYGMSIYTTMSRCLLALSISPDHMAQHEISMLSQAPGALQHLQPASVFRSLTPLRPAVMPNQAETRILTQALNLAVRYARNAHRAPELPPATGVTMIHPIDVPWPLITADGVVRHQMFWNTERPVAAITDHQREAFRAMSERHQPSETAWHVDLYAHPAVFQPHRSRGEPPYHPVTVIYHPDDRSGQYLAVQYAGPPSAAALQTTLLIAISVRKRRPQAMQITEPVLLDALAPAADILGASTKPAMDDRPLPQKLSDIIEKQDPDFSLQFPMAHPIHTATEEIREMDRKHQPLVRHRCAHINPLQRVLLSPHPSPGTGHIKPDDLADAATLSETLRIAAAHADDDLDLEDVAQMAVKAGTAPPRIKTARSLARAITRRDPDWRRVDERLYHRDGPRPENLPAFTTDDHFRHLIFTDDA